MFNEALYLHQLIKQAFSQPSLRPLIILAYCLPFITTTSYIMARYFTTGSININIIEDAVESSHSDFLAQFHASFSNNNSSNSGISSPLHSGGGGGGFESIEINGNPNQFTFYHQQLNDKVSEAIRGLLVRLPKSDVTTITTTTTTIAATPEHRHSKRLSTWDDDLFEDYGGKHRESQHRPHQLLRGQHTDVYQGEKAAEQIFDDVNSDDSCWMMPSYEAWHEWIINVPNLAILIVSPLLPPFSPLLSPQYMNSVIDFKQLLLGFSQVQVD